MSNICWKIFPTRNGQDIKMGTLKLSEKIEITLYGLKWQKPSAEFSKKYPHDHFFHFSEDPENEIALELNDGLTLNAECLLEENVKRKSKKHVVYKPLTNGHGIKLKFSHKYPPPKFDVDSVYTVKIVVHGIKILERHIDFFCYPLYHIDEIK